MTCPAVHHGHSDLPARRPPRTTWILRFRNPDACSRLAALPHRVAPHRETHELNSDSRRLTVDGLPKGF